MPMVERRDGTLWVDIRDLSEVDAIRRRLSELSVPVTALVPDPACGVTVDEVAWGDLYPRIVPRNGPEPGIIVQPAAIPPAHTLLVAAQTVARAPHPPKVVVELILIRGPAPPCFGKVSSRARPVHTDPRFRPARPPPLPSESAPNLSHRRQHLGASRAGGEDVSHVMLHIERADQETQGQLWVLSERLPEPLSVGSRSWEFWVSFPHEFGEAKARQEVRNAIEAADLNLITVA